MLTPRSCDGRRRPKAKGLRPKGWSRKKGYSPIARPAQTRARPFRAVSGAGPAPRRATEDIRREEARRREAPRQGPDSDTVCVPPVRMICPMEESSDCMGLGSAEIVFGYKRGFSRGGSADHRPPFRPSLVSVAL